MKQALYTSNVPPKPHPWENYYLPGTCFFPNLFYTLHLSKFYHNERSLTRIHDRCLAHFISVPPRFDAHIVYTIDLRAVAKGIIIWEPTVAACIPETRRYNANATSNIVPLPKKGKPQGPLTPAMRDYVKAGLEKRRILQAMIDKVNGMTDVEGIADYIGSNGKTRLKYVAWNFAHIGKQETRKDPINTIEFRRHVDFLYFSSPFSHRYDDFTLSPWALSPLRSQKVLRRVDA